MSKSTTQTSALCPLYRAYSIIPHTNTGGLSKSLLYEAYAGHQNLWSPKSQRTMISSVAVGRVRYFCSWTSFDFSVDLNGRPDEVRFMVSWALVLDFFLDMIACREKYSLFSHRVRETVCWGRIDICVKLKRAVIYMTTTNPTCTVQFEIKLILETINSVSSLDALQPTGEWCSPRRAASIWSIPEHIPSLAQLLTSS